MRQAPVLYIMGVGSMRTGCPSASEVRELPARLMAKGRIPKHDQHKPAGLEAIPSEARLRVLTAHSIAYLLIFQMRTGRLVLELQ